MKDPRSNGKSASVGFCFGGAESFAFAVAEPGLNAAVVYYGQAPTDAPPAARGTPPGPYLVSDRVANVKAPILGLYGGLAQDARIGNTVAPTEEKMKALGKTYEPHIFDGAAHGFLRAQTGNDGANMKATEQAWPMTIAWLKKYTVVESSYSAGESESLSPHPLGPSDNPKPFSSVQLRAARPFGHSKGTAASFGMAKETAKQKLDVLQGTLDLMILQTLSALGPLNGFAIARRLEQVSEAVLRLNEGTVYTALLRLQHQGWIESKWGASDSNRKAKFYSITRRGRSQLTRETEDWRRMASVIQRILALDKG